MNSEYRCLHTYEMYKLRGSHALPKEHNVNVVKLPIRTNYEGWNFNSDNYLFTTDTK